MSAGADPLRLALVPYEGLLRRARSVAPPARQGHRRLLVALVAELRAAAVVLRHIFIHKPRFPSVSA